MTAVATEVCRDTPKMAAKHVTKEEAISKTLEVVGDSLSATSQVEKYYLVDEQGYLESTPMDMWRRLARANSLAEKPEIQREFEDKFCELLWDYKFVPGGRILMGLGNKFVNVTLKNCYVIGILEDSIKGIFDAAYKIAETLKGGGGVGTDVSILRPRGSAVKNAARFSTGAVSFLPLFSQVTGMIGQKARIGAMLVSIDISHPDIEEFIEIKGSNDLEYLRFINISIKISDEFMRCVEGDLPFDLRWGGKVYKTIKARELWGKIVHYAWKRAEPGLLFWDETCRTYPAHQYDSFKCLTTNPCFSGSMRLQTETGYKTMRELWAEGEFLEYGGAQAKYGNTRIVNSNGVVNATNVYRTSENSEIYRVTLGDGSFVDVTENHMFLIQVDHNIIKKQTKDLVPGDKIPYNTQSSFGEFNYPEYALLAGWVIGDGSISFNKKTNQMKAYVPCYENDIEAALPILRENLLSIYKKSTISTGQNPAFEGYEQTPDGFSYTKKTMSSIVLGRLLKEDGLVPGNKHQIPKKIWNGNNDTVSAFVRGIFSADGSVQVNENKGTISIRLSQSRLEILHEIQILLNQLGIRSTIIPFRRKACKKYMNDGKGGMKLYNKRAEHELIISGLIDCKEFIKKVSFIQKWKNDIALAWFEGHKGSNNTKIREYTEVKSIEYLGNEETFCLTEPENHEVTVNGIRIGNCGELAASHADSCNLGSMVLNKYVRNSFEKNASFDFVSFDRDVRLAVRFLDNIISLEKTPLPEQQWANDNGRRLGLGFMGLADMLMRMRLKFDSDQAIELVEKVSRQLMISSYDASCDLAQEKGAFPVFDYSTHLKSEFIKKLPHSILERIKKTGLRNIGLNAIAPTGTISCVAQCSSSLEPVFALKYIRRTNLGTAKEVKEYEVFPAVVQEYMQKYNCKFEELPDFFVGAHDIHPRYRIKLQSIIQKYTDQSISNTVNLPKDCKEEEIAYYYSEAWKQGIKGITVYREGSREGVLVTEKKHEAGEIQVHQSPRRPDELDGVVHVIKPNGRTFTVFVGLLGGRVFEVFALDHKVAALADGMQGKIIKHAGADGINTYYFESGAVTVQKLNKFEDDEMSLLTRLISTSLRHGTPIEFIVDQICKSKITIKSPGKAIAQALAKYMKQEEVRGKFKCPKCGGNNIKFEGLCKICLDCSWSLCG
jgi:ribonucleoside-diphosphate reductase alpha chain